MTLGEFDKLTGQSLLRSGVEPLWSLVKKARLEVLFRSIRKCCQNVKMQRLFHQGSCSTFEYFFSALTEKTLVRKLCPAKRAKKGTKHREAVHALVADDPLKCPAGVGEGNMTDREEQKGRPQRGKVGKKESCRKGDWSQTADPVTVGLCLFALPDK